MHVSFCVTRRRLAINSIYGNRIDERGVCFRRNRFEILYQNIFNEINEGISYNVTHVLAVSGNICFARKASRVVHLVVTKCRLRIFTVQSIRHERDNWYLSLLLSETGALLWIIILRLTLFFVFKDCVEIGFTARWTWTFRNKYVVLFDVWQDGRFYDKF